MPGAAQIGLGTFGMARQARFRHAQVSVVLRTNVHQATGDARRLLLDGGASVFQSAQWIEGFVNTIAAARDCRFFQATVRETGTGRMLLLLPLLLRRARGLRIIEVPDFGLADYVAPLIAAGFDPDAAMMQRIWEEIRTLLPPADLIRLVKMPESIAGRRNPLLLVPGTTRSAATAWGVALPAPGAAWTEAIVCPKRRADIDARWRKLNKRGRVEFRTAATDAEADLYFEALLRQRAERFQTMNFPNALDKPEIRAFYRGLLRPGLPESPAVLQALLIDGVPIATGYGFIGNGAYHMIFPTFQAETWRNYSPGLHLFRKSMEWAAEQGLTYYDFTVGAEGFKRDFGAREQPLFERYEALSPRGVAPLAYVSARRFIKARPRLAAAVSALKSRIVAGGR